MLPEPAVARRAAALARAHGVDTVWFGAAAPLALLGPRLRRTAGVAAGGREHATATRSAGRCCPAPGRRCAASASDADVVTTVSRYTRGRVAAAFGPTAALEPLPPGHRRRRCSGPDPAARAAAAAPLRPRRRAGRRLRVPAGGAQGPGRADPRRCRGSAARVPGTRLLLVGRRTRRPDGCARLAAGCGVADAVVFAGAVPAAELPAHHAVGDVFALPCRTRGGGLDVEGLGIVAAGGGGRRAAGGRRATPAARRRPCATGETGHVVDGRDLAALPTRSSGCSPTPTGPRAMGAAGPGRWMVPSDWTLAGAGGAACSGLLGGPRSLGVRPRLAVQAPPRVRLFAARRRCRRCRRRSFSATTARLTFIVGVISPPASVKSTGRMRNSRICSARDTAWLASATAVADLARAGPGRPPGRATPSPAGLPVRSSQPGSASASTVTSAAMNGLPSPTTMHWLDQRVRPQPVLQHGGRDVLAARRDDELLLAAGDRAGSPRRRARRCRRCGTSRRSIASAVAVSLLPVAAEHDRALDAGSRRRRRCARRARAPAARRCRRAARRGC